MAVVSNVALGSKRIDLEAFTGEAVEAQLTEHTTTEHYRENGWAKTRRSTSHWCSFKLRDANGKEQSAEVWQSIATVKPGQRVTLFWGVKGKKTSNWLAVYNHATEYLGYVPGPLNKLAGPGGNWHGLMLFGCGVIQFFTLFGMFQWRLSAWVMFLVLCPPWVWVHNRRKALKQAIRDAIPQLGQAQPLVTNAAPVTRDREVRI